MNDSITSDIRIRLRDAADDGKKYFSEARSHVKSEDDYNPFPFLVESNHYWKQIPEELREVASELLARILPTCAALAEATRTSLLTGNEDLQEVKFATKGIRAALRLRHYTYREPDVIHDEGTILGFRPADQSETYGCSPEEAESEFSNYLSNLSAVLKLVEASPRTSSGALINDIGEVTKYRSDTAFIMMWMDPQQPELTDVADTVRDVFRSFDIRAVRADDIEHEGLISERVLNEIRTAEFLFADLSGTRPNVYYEVGYAHALGKRVILFRKAGTGIHFDLAGYNCPEYENLRDLRGKLAKRLVSLTNRNPNESTKEI